MRAGIVVYRMGRRPRHRGGPHFSAMRAIPLGLIHLARGSGSPPSPSRWFASGTGSSLPSGRIVSTVIGVDVTSDDTPCRFMAIPRLTRRPLARARPLAPWDILDRKFRLVKIPQLTRPPSPSPPTDLMYEQTKALMEGKAVDKPIYNHVTGVFDPAEKIESPSILILEGLHPFADERVRDMFDFKIYLDISDDVKFAWKIQRDMAERGHSLESIKASIEARKPDFDEFVDPQKQYADVIIQVLPTQLIPDDNEGKILRVRMIMKEGVENFDAPYLFDEGSTISWIPCGRKLTCSYPGIKFFYGPDTFFGEEVSVLEMDGQFDKLEELIYVESHLSNTSTKFYGEITQQMLKYQNGPGSNNGTGLFQTLCGLKVRELYERISEKEVVTAA